MVNKENLDIQSIKDILCKLGKLPARIKEKTFFDIGTRGHFENPTTDVLSFFINGAEEHQMGNLVFNGLALWLSNQYQLNIQDTNIPVHSTREVVTNQRNRIDLLIESEQWILVIEAKVKHDQINPFQDYECYGDKLAQEKGKEVFYAILSPEGIVDDEKSNHRWFGISYANLIAAIKPNFNHYFFDKPFNKWSLIFKDYLLHLENLAMDHTPQSYESEFVLENLTQISNAWSLLSSTLTKIDTQVRTNVLTFSERAIKCKKHTWFEPLPAYIYQFEASQINVVLFASPTEIKDDEANKNKHLFIQIHVEDINLDQLYEIIKNSLGQKVVDHWISGETGYLRWPIDGLDLSEIVKEVTTTLSLTQVLELNERQY